MIHARVYYVELNHIQQFVKFCDEIGLGVEIKVEYHPDRERKVIVGGDGYTWIQQVDFFQEQQRKDDIIYIGMTQEYFDQK